MVPRARRFTVTASASGLYRLDHGTASPGKMGARARVYWQNGSLWEAPATRYNGQETDYFSVEAPRITAEGKCTHKASRKLGMVTATKKLLRIGR